MPKFESTITLKFITDADDREDADAKAERMLQGTLASANRAAAKKAAGTLVVDAHAKTRRARICRGCGEPTSSAATAVGSAGPTETAAASSAGTRPKRPPIRPRYPDRGRAETTAGPENAEERQMSWLEHHRRSEELASTAEAALRRGEMERARSLHSAAAYAEEQALDELPPGRDRTYGITAVSAVSLHQKAGNTRAAAELAARCLEQTGLPGFARAELTR